MLLEITTTAGEGCPATDLGYLLHKHPARVQEFDLNVGRAHVYYPEATAQRCTAALLLDIDPVGLVRGRKSFSLAQYVNDRPYVASSFLSVAIAKVYGSALNGNSQARQALADTAIPLEARVVVVSAPSAETIHNLFEPLGYTVETIQHTLDPQFPQWGESRYYTLTLRHTIRLADLLTHLYVLIPALDAYKHYYIGQNEVEKLLRRGEGWLPDHPERNFITRRYLGRWRDLTGDAIRRLAEEATPQLEEETDDDPQDAEEEAAEKPLSLHKQRLQTVIEALKAAGASTILDLGCGEGKLLRELARHSQFTRVVGVDVSARALARAERRLGQVSSLQRDHIELMQGALTYRDRRLAGFDAAVLVEVIEHIDPMRLTALEQVVFGHAAPRTIVITTPNADYNTLWESLPAGRFRHRDHRFEWSRAEFAAWAERAARSFGYHVEFSPIGPVDDEVGAPTQMAVFTLEAYPS